MNNKTHTMTYDQHCGFGSPAKVNSRLYSKAVKSIDTKKRVLNALLMDMEGLNVTQAELTALQEEINDYHHIINIFEP